MPSNDIVSKKYYKSLKNNVKKSINNDSHRSIKGVSIITCTNRPEFINNILSNFFRQKYENKELIIILCNNKISKKIWLDKCNSYKGIRIYEMKKASLGSCLNFGVTKSNFDVVAKFDDDDYYSTNYLNEAIKMFENNRIDVVGKGSTIVYFTASQTLAIRNPNLENIFVNFVNGSTLVFRKRIFNKVKFQNVSIGEDVLFCKDCIRNKIKIYSTSRFNHVYKRYANKSKHTWKINDSELIRKHCKVIGRTTKYIEYANGII